MERPRQPPRRPLAYIIKANESAAIAALRAFLAAQHNFKREDYYDIGSLVYANPSADQGVGNGYPDLYRIGYRVGESEGKGPVLDLITIGYANAHYRAKHAKPRSGYLFDDLERYGASPFSFTTYWAICAVPAEYGVTGRNTFIIDITGTVYKRDTGGRPLRTYPSESGLRKWRPIVYE